MSVLERGLPSGFFTRGRAIATGLGVALVVILGFNIYAVVKYYFFEPKTAPACYGTQQVAGKQIIAPSGTGEGRTRAVNDRRPGIDTAKIISAMAVCTAQSCPKTAWKEYRSAMFWYLSPRLQHISRLYRNYGDVGLLRAREIYREPIDVQVEQGLRERYAAGIFRLNDFRQHHAAFSIIVLKGGDALRPCRVGEPAEDED